MNSVFFHFDNLKRPIRQLCILFFTISMLAVEPVQAQQTLLDGSNAVPEYSAAEIKSIEDQGSKLEAAKSWRAALRFYERAQRSYPGQAVIAERVRLSRAHVDIARRYHDASYLRSLEMMDLELGQSVYREILAKVDTYYFANPNWQDILQSGVSQLQVAVSDDLFCGQHEIRPTETQFGEYQRAVTRWTDSHPCRSQRDVLLSATTISGYASEYLQIPQSAALLELLSGTIISLDRYSSYLTGTQLDDMFSQIEGNFVGLGIELRIQETHLLVERVIADGPAAEAGIRGGDRIIEVDRNMIPDVASAKAADMLKGMEGTKIEIVVVSASGAARRMVLVRRRVQVSSVVDVKMLENDGRVGYFRVVSFQKNTPRDVQAALLQLRQNGMQRLVIDIRGNPGGLVTSAVEIADMFLDQGTIVSTRGRSVNEDMDYQAHQAGTWIEPLVVLIDDRSASASEIFAGAIKDHQRGAIVGHSTYGKGSVQGIFPLASFNCGLRLTTARFYSPHGHQISQRGVLPDVEVRMLAKPLEDGTLPLAQSDPILFAGIEIVKSRK
ncbi:MAG: S41 family peptidase [Planctomycetota bacterium]|nr:S41 family peptidase [Planctomycetota bacterium]